MRKSCQRWEHAEPSNPVNTRREKVNHLWLKQISTQHLKLICITSAMMTYNRRTHPNITATAVHRRTHLTHRIKRPNHLWLLRKQCWKVVLLSTFLSISRTSNEEDNSTCLRQWHVQSKLRRRKNPNWDNFWNQVQKEAVPAAHRPVPKKKNLVKRRKRRKKICWGRRSFLTLKVIGRSSRTTGHLKWRQHTTPQGKVHQASRRRA